MQHAYCIIAHSYPQQLWHLIGLLDDDRNDIYIHIDQKIDIQLFTPPHCNYRSNVKFIDKRVKVYWGHYSQIVCELNLLEAVIASGKEYSYIHLISGVDMPLKPQDDIHDFCDKHMGEEFIQFDNSDFNIRDLKEKTEYPYYWGRHKRLNGLYSRTVGRVMFRISRMVVKGLRLRSHYDFDLHKGSQWFSITGGLAHWLVNNRKSILNAFKHVWCPDEMMVQTFVLLSPFAGNISPHGNLRKIDWERGGPYTWQDDDYDELVNSDAMFARKFSMRQAPELIKKLTKDLTKCH